MLFKLLLNQTQLPVEVLNTTDLTWPGLKLCFRLIIIHIYLPLIPDVPLAVVHQVTIDFLLSNGFKFVYLRSICLHTILFVHICKISLRKLFRLCSWGLNPRPVATASQLASSIDRPSV